MNCDGEHRHSYIRLYMVYNKKLYVVDVICFVVFKLYVLLVASDYGKHCTYIREIKFRYHYSNYSPAVVKAICTR